MHIDNLSSMCYYQFTSEVNPVRGGDVDITYKNNKIRKICTDPKTADRIYGKEMTGKIYQRINEIRAADCVEMMVQFHIGRCHRLTQNRRGQYAVDLIHPYRLVFEKVGDIVQIAVILEIVDYH